MNCDQTRRYTSAYLDSELETLPSLEIARHLDACPACKERFATESRIEKGIAEALAKSGDDSTSLARLERFVNGLSATVTPGTPARRRGRPVLLAAAVVVLAAGAWLLWSREREHDPLPALALLAMNDHLDTHTMELSTEDPGILAEWFSGRVPFAVRFPDLGVALRLVGGRRCTLGTHPVAFSTWKDGAWRFTLLQLRRSDFDLPAQLPPTVVTPREAAARARPLDVLLWTEGEFGYALVADDAGALLRVRAALR